jgi:hypothetical protein
LGASVLASARLTTVAAELREAEEQMRQNNYINVLRDPILMSHAQVK